MPKLSKIFHQFSSEVKAAKDRGELRCLEERIDTYYVYGVLNEDEYKKLDLMVFDRKNMKRTKKIQSLIVDRVSKGLCLQCDFPAKRRGLCRTHYYRWQRDRAAMANKKERADFDQTCQRHGLLLSPQEVRALKEQADSTKAQNIKRS